MIKKEKARVNVRARLNRHLRIVKENIGTNDINKSKKNSNHHYGIVLFFILLVVPIYPTLASFIYNTSRYDFYRGDIDESSIIESFYGGDGTDEELNNPILESSDSFISVNTMLDDKRDLDGTNEIVDYEVNPGDSFYSISYKFEVSTNSIYWANDFTKDHLLKPGEIIKVPPVTGLIHQVKSGDTISAIAKKYNIKEEVIKKQNGLGNEGQLVAGEVLMLPGAIKIIPKPVYKQPVKTYTKTSVKKGNTSSAPAGASQYVNQTGKYKLTRRQPKHAFVWGNCTWYVGQYKNVNWGGNANTWLKNAKAAGNATGSTPDLGAIVQLTGRGYNPRYGHVGIVTDITATDIIITDMNYRRLNEVTSRKIAINDRAIDGYIYVD